MASIGIADQASNSKPESAIFTQPDGGGRSAAPAASGLAARAAAGKPATLWQRIVARYEDSVWMPVGLRLAGIGIGMLSLAAIGAVSIAAGLEGVQAPNGLPLTADVHSAWLASVAASPSARGDAHERGREGAGAGVAGGARARSAKPCSSKRSGVEHGGNDANAQCADGGAAPSAGITADGKVILNVASADDMTRLPGVGKRRAEAILELRTRLKRFKRPQDLLRVKGIGVRGLKRMLPHLVLDPPVAAANGVDGGR